jgi:hypothetical protein
VSDAVPTQAVPTQYVIVRDDGSRDGIAGQQFSSYDEAYDVLERYYGDLCCSDEREYYRVVALADSADQPSAR